MGICRVTLECIAPLRVHIIGGADKNIDALTSPIEMDGWMRTFSIVFPPCHMVLPSSHHILYRSQTYLRKLSSATCDENICCMPISTFDNKLRVIQIFTCTLFATQKQSGGSMPCLYRSEDLGICQSWDPNKQLQKSRQYNSQG